MYDITHTETGSSATAEQDEELTVSDLRDSVESVLEEPDHNSQYQPPILPNVAAKQRSHEDNEATSG